MQCLCPQKLGTGGIPKMDVHRLEPKWNEECEFLSPWRRLRMPNDDALIKNELLLLARKQNEVKLDTQTYS